MPSLRITRSALSRRALRPPSKLPLHPECDHVSATRYLTQFICTCLRCGHETMAVEIDGTIIVECGSCDNRHTFDRPRRRLTTSTMATILQGHFGSYGG